MSDFWSNPGAAMYPGMYPGMGMPGTGTGMPGMGTGIGANLKLPSQRPPAFPGFFRNRNPYTPRFGYSESGMPQGLNQLAGMLSNNTGVDPSRFFAGMPMNPRYAQYAGMGGPPSPGGGKLGGGIQLPPPSMGGGKAGMPPPSMGGGKGPI